MSDRCPPPTRRILTLATLVVVLLVLVQLLPDLGHGDLFREEGRRVIPAREMLASGDWIVPTIWRTPYLTKPPGFYWILATSFQLAGSVTEFAARLPSLLASLATALGLLWVGARLFTWRAGFFAAILFTLSVEVLKKGRLAEIEAPLALFVFVSVCAWWLGRRGSWWWTILSGLSLAMALFLKGPAGLLLFIGPPLALALRDRSPRELLSLRLWLPLFVAVSLAGVWVALVIGQLGYEQTVGTWTGEKLGKGTFVGYLEQRGKYVLGTLFAFYPATFLLLLAIGTPAWKRLKGSPHTPFAFWAAASGWLFFLFFPGAQVRYAYPMLPFAALLGGVLFEEAFCAVQAPVFIARLSRTSRVLGGLALALPPAAVIGYFVPLGEVTVNEWGLILGALFAALSYFLLRRGGEARWRIVGGFVLLPLLVGQILSSQVGAATIRRHQRAHLAHELDETVPPGEPLHVGFWLNFCALSYVEHEVRYVPHFDELAPDSWLLLTDQQFAEAARTAEGPVVFEEVLRRMFWAGERVLVRVRRVP